MEKFFFCILLLLCSFILTSCHSHTVTEKILAEEPEKSESIRLESLKLDNCHNELQSLKKINNDNYEKLKRNFDVLMSGTAEYASIRQNVTTTTQDTVDALYRYRVNLLCNEVSNTLLNSLVTAERN